MQICIPYTAEELAEREAKEKQKEQAEQEHRAAMVEMARNRAAQSIAKRGKCDREILRDILTDAGIAFKDDGNGISDSDGFSIEAGYVGFVTEISFDEFGNLTDIEAYE